MRSPRHNYWQRAVPLIAAALLASCSSSRPSTLPRAELTGDRGVPVVVYVMDFFNNENSQRFEPKPIDYSHMIDLRQFYSLAKGRLAEDGIRLVEIDDLRITALGELAEGDRQQIQLSLYNTLVIPRAFLLGLPQPAGFKGAPMPGLVALKSEPPDWRANGAIYVVVGLETTVGVTATGHELRSGLAVVRLQPNGEYQDIVFSTYDFTNIDAAELSVLVSDSVNRLQRPVPPLSEGHGGSNSRLQATAAKGGLSLAPPRLSHRR
jgi:hypothetical protein